MVAKRKKPPKTPNVGLCCRRCGQPTRVYYTRTVDDFAVDRVRKCVACGWKGKTTETFAPHPPPSAA